MSVFRKAAVYLGLVDDEDDEVYEYEDVADDGAPDRAVARPRSSGDGGAGVVRPIREPQLAHPEQPSQKRVANPLLYCPASTVTFLTPSTTTTLSMSGSPS